MTASQHRQLLTRVCATLCRLGIADGDSLWNVGPDAISGPKPGFGERLAGAALLPASERALLQVAAEVWSGEGGTKLADLGGLEDWQLWGVLTCWAILAADAPAEVRAAHLQRWCDAWAGYGIGTGQTQGELPAAFDVFNVQATEGEGDAGAGVEEAPASAPAPATPKKPPAKKRAPRKAAPKKPPAKKAAKKAPAKKAAKKAPAKKDKGKA